MTNGKKDDPGKGPVWPSDKRPHATIDVQATEVGGDKPKTAAAAGAALPPPQAAKPEPAKPEAAKPEPGRSTFAGRLAAAGELSRQAVRSNGFLSNLAAGVAGAVLTLIATALLGLLPSGGGGDEQGSADLGKRIAALERQRPATPAGDISAKFAQTDTRIKSLEEQARAISALGAAQAKLAGEIKALDARGGSPELAERLGKIEAALAAASAGDAAARGPQGVAVAAKLADIEKVASDALEAAKSASSRSDQELAVIKTEAVRLAQRLDALKSDIDVRLKGAAKSSDLAPVLSKLAAFEQDLQQFLKGEGERNTNAQRVLLTLEIANLKRAMDRGDRYAPELDSVRKVAGSTLNLAPLERYALEGVPTLPALTREFRRVANAAIDADSEPADASVWERLLAGAKSIVRVRKTGQPSDDMSVEAVIGRMEAALKEGRLGEVLAQGAKLPPKPALAAEDWLRKVQARYAVDQSVAEIETALKATLAARAPEPATELKR